MSRSVLAEQKLAKLESHTGLGRREQQGREMTDRFLRFLIKELQTCRTNAEREVLIPALWEAWIRLRRPEMNWGMPTELRE